MIRLLTLLLLFLVYTQSSFASDATITIRQKGGNETVLELSTKPIITFEGENMVVTNEFTRVVIPMDDIKEYIVSEAATGISVISATPQFENGRIRLTDLPKGLPICIHTIDGKLVSKQYADDSGKASIDLTSLPKSVCVISVQNRKIKIINKRNK